MSDEPEEPKAAGTSEPSGVPEDRPDLTWTPLTAPVSPDDDLAWLERHHHNREHRHGGSGRSRHGRGHGRRRHGRGRRHPHWYRPRNTIVLPLLVLILLVGGFLFYVNHELGSIRKAPLNADFAGPPSIGTNVLLIASNAPTGAVQADVKTMVVQLIHFGADGAHASLIDLPRDLVLPGAGGRATVAGRYLRSGATALATDLQSVLGITIEHVVQADYAGYVKATDRLGGVDVSTGTGSQHLSGAQALAYVDQPGVNSVVAGQRNQHWLRGLIEGTLTPGVLLNPFKIIGLLRDLIPALVSDEGFTAGAIRSLGWHERGLSPSQTRYLTAPYKRYVGVAGGVVLLPDLQGLQQLGAAIRADNDSGIAVFDN